MNNILRRFKAKWGRPKHHGVSGNFSTVVILAGVVISGWILTGGGYPQVYPKYTQTPIIGEPLAEQPEHTGQPAMTMRELLMRVLPPKESDSPTNTFCEKQSIAFLVDVSGSMLEANDGGTKIEKVRSAMKEVAENLSDDALLAVYSFSEPFDGVPNAEAGETGSEPDIPEPRQRLPMTRYGEISADYNGIINGLIPYRFAATYMRDGFVHTEQWLKEAKSQYPDYEQTLIFISDGVPETDVRGSADQCLNPPTCNRSYSQAEDPTIGSNLGDLIKSNGANIYSVMIYTETESNNPQLFTIFSGILKNVATQPSAPYYYESLNASDISTILQDITDNVCGAG